MLDLRYDPIAREGYVKLRTGRSVRSRPLSAEAQAEYDRRGQLLSISIRDLDATAAEFLRTSDEETLLRVIAAQAGAGKAGFRRGGRPPAPEQPAARPKPRPKPKPKPKPKARPAAKPEAKAEAPDGEAAGAPKKRRRRRRSGANKPDGGAPPAAAGS
jgi:hypothetical protein